MCFGDNTKNRIPAYDASDTAFYRYLIVSCCRDCPSIRKRFALLTAASVHL